MTLAQKMAAIYCDVPRFEKSKKVTGSGPSYDYTPIEAIADWLRIEMGKHGIIMVPSKITPLIYEEAGVTRSGTTRWRYVMLVDWTITDGETSITVSSMGEAIDTGDKGSNKAQTAARKYALLGAFQLSTGADDPDARHPDAPKPPAEVARERADFLLSVGPKAVVVAAMKDAGIKSADLHDGKTYDEAKALVTLAVEAASAEPKAAA